MHGCFSAWCRGLGLKIVLLAVVMVAAIPAHAQYQTGNIYGTVSDSNGNPLPGVTVALSGVGAPQTFMTDAQGNFRFLNLDPGDYAIRAELSGLGQATRSAA